MISKNTFYIVFISMLISGCTQAGSTNSNSTLQSQVDAFASKLANREIGQVEILQIPSYVLTRTTITPSMLEKQFHYKLIIRDMRGGISRDEMATVMASARVEPTTETADIRWGIIFYDPEGNRIGGIYLDKRGRRGAVGNNPVSFKGDLFEWLDRRFSKSFR